MPSLRHRLCPKAAARARSLDTTLPWSYLHGISTGDLREALAALVGTEAAGLSVSVVARLRSRWGEEYRSWRRTKLGKERWVYLRGRWHLLGASRRGRAARAPWW